MSKSPSYTWAFLAHPYNKALTLGAAALGVLASFPFGVDALVMTALAFVAVEIVGLATFPALPAFRATVDTNAARAERDSTRAKLLEEIDKQGGSAHVRSYEQMCERVDSLYRTATDSTTTLTEQDVGELDRLTVDYLRMCLSDAVMKDQDGAALAASVARKMKDVDQRLAQDGLGKDEQMQLGRARTEYEEVLARQARMATRRSVLEASLISMPVRMDEVYQMVMTAPRAGDLGALLEESVSKLRIAEEVTMDVDQAYALRKVAGTDGVSAAAPAPPPRRAVAGRQ